MAANPKSTGQKRYVKRPDVRKALLDAAEALFIEQGYASATVRQIAAKAGQKHQAIFYYYGSQEKLLLALYQRAADLHEERLNMALNSEDPIRGIWEVVSDPKSTALTLEFNALAHHKEIIRCEIARRSQEFRIKEIEAIQKHLEKRGIPARISPSLVSILTTALAQAIAQEQTLGIHTDHKEIMALIEKSFASYEASGKTESEADSLLAALIPMN